MKLRSFDSAFLPPAPINKGFPCFADAQNLERITPLS